MVDNCTCNNDLTDEGSPLSWSARFLSSRRVSSTAQSAPAQGPTRTTRNTRQDKATTPAQKTNSFVTCSRSVRKRRHRQTKLDIMNFVRVRRLGACRAPLRCSSRVSDCQSVSLSVCQSVCLCVCVWQCFAARVLSIHSCSSRAEVAEILQFANHLRGGNTPSVSKRSLHLRRPSFFRVGPA